VSEGLVMCPVCGCNEAEIVRFTSMIPVEVICWCPACEKYYKLLANGEFMELAEGDF